jgi:hypothetical protein
VVHVPFFFAFRDDLPQRGFSFWASISSDLGSQFRMVRGSNSPLSPQLTKSQTRSLINFVVRVTLRVTLRKPHKPSVNRPLLRCYASKPAPGGGGGIRGFCNVSAPKGGTHSPRGIVSEANRTQSGLTKSAGPEPGTHPVQLSLRGNFQPLPASSSIILSASLSITQ